MQAASRQMGGCPGGFGSGTIGRYKGKESGLSFILNFSAVTLPNFTSWNMTYLLLFTFALNRAFGQKTTQNSLFLNHTEYNQIRVN